MISERETNKKNNRISNLDLKIQKYPSNEKCCHEKQTKYTYYIRAQLPLLSHFWYLKKNKQKKNKS